MSATTQLMTADELLKLPASERADLAMALWDSLSDEEREAEGFGRAFGVVIPSVSDFTRDLIRRLPEFVNSLLRSIAQSPQKTVGPIQPAEENQQDGENEHDFPPTNKGRDDRVHSRDVVQATRLSPRAESRGEKAPTSRHTPKHAGRSPAQFIRFRPDTRRDFARDTWRRKTA